MKSILKIVTVVVIATGVILSTLEYLNNNNISPTITLLLSFLLGLLTTIIASVISNLKSESISNSFEKTMASIFFTAFIITIILTVLLVIQWIPNYFNSIYILLGSIMVAVIGLYLNSRLEKEKEARKVRRIIYLVNDAIKSNKGSSENIINQLSSNKAIELDINLKKGYWSILDSNIVDLNIDPEIVRDLLLIKELTLDINSLIGERMQILDGFIGGMPKEVYLLDVYTLDDLQELTQVTDKLTEELKRLIDLSTEFLTNNQI